MKKLSVSRFTFRQIQLPVRVPELEKSTGRATSRNPKLEPSFCFLCVLRVSVVKKSVRRGSSAGLVQALDFGELAGGFGATSGALQA